MKRCSKCGLSVDEGAVFGKHKETKDGLRCDCNKCRSKENPMEDVMKKCGKCNIEKNVSEFHKNAWGKNGLNSICKSCKNKTVKEYHYKNIDSVRARHKIYNESNSDKIREYQKMWVIENPDKMKEKDKRWRDAHPDKVKKRNTSVTSRISRLMRKSLKDGKAGRHWENLVNYSLDDLVKHLKKTLPDGYIWKDYINNKTDLSIDHIIPVAVHNFKSYTDTDFQRCWALKNLRLLPLKQNISKGAKLEKPFQPTLF